MYHLYITLSQRFSPCLALAREIVNTFLERVNQPHAQRTDFSVVEADVGVGFAVGGADEGGQRFLAEQLMAQVVEVDGVGVAVGFFIAEQRVGLVEALFAELQAGAEGVEIAAVGVVQAQAIALVAHRAAVQLVLAPA